MSGLKDNVFLATGALFFFLFSLMVTAFALTFISLQHILIILALGLMGVFLVIKALRVFEDKVERHLQEAGGDSIVDEENGLSSLQYFNRRVIDEMKISQRYGNRSFSLIQLQLVGLTEFLQQLPDKSKEKKKFKMIAQALTEKIRDTDLIAYSGNGYFMILTPEQGEGKASLIERLKTLFENMKEDFELKLKGQDLSMKIKAVDYPGNHEIVQDLMRKAVEVA